MAGRVNCNSLKLRASDCAAIFVKWLLRTYWMCHDQKHDHMLRHLNGLSELVQMFCCYGGYLSLKGFQLHYTWQDSSLRCLYTNKNQYRICNYCCLLFLTYVRSSWQQLPSNQGWSTVCSEASTSLMAGNKFPACASSGGGNWSHLKEAEVVHGISHWKVKG